MSAVMTPSAFEKRRQETNERVTLELASELAKQGAEKAARAASLMSTASALPDRRSVLRDGPAGGDGRDGWLASLREAHAHLTEVLSEMDRADKAPAIPLRGQRAGR